MAKVEIVFIDGEQLVPLILDAVPQERHKISATATSIAVERGVDISDHVRPNRDPLTVEVVISDTPIEPNDAIGGSFQSVTLDLGAARKEVERDGSYQQGSRRFSDPTFATKAAPEQRATLYRPDQDEPSRVVDAWELLLDARDRRLLAIVTTKLRTYEDMVLIEAETTRTSKDGTWLHAGLTFVPVVQVATETVDDDRRPARPRGEDQDHRGTRVTQPATDAESGALTSILRRLTGGA